MNLSMSAAEYKWHIYTGKRVTKVYYTKTVKGQETAYELPFAKDNIFGVKEMRDGSAIIVDMEDQSYKYRISADDVTKLLRNSTAYSGKVTAPKAAIKESDLAKDKNDPNAYKWHVYNGTRGKTIYKVGGAKAGILRKGESFGIFTGDPAKGGFFLADPGVKDPSFGLKPIKMSGDELADLLIKSSPLKKRPIIKPVTDGETKPKLEPTIEPKNGMPSVVDLKALNKKVSDVNNELKQLAGKSVKTLADYQSIKSKMESIRDVEVEGIKEYMQTINVPTQMGLLIMKLIGDNWHSSVAVISAKKLAVEKGPAEEEYVPQPQSSAPLTIGRDEQVKAPDDLKADLLQSIKDKGKEIKVATEVHEVENLLADLNEVYLNAATAMKEAMPTRAQKIKLKQYLAEFKGAYDKAKGIMEAKLKLFTTPVIEDPDTEWADDAEIPNTDFTPIDEDAPVVDDDNTPASQDDLDLLDDLLGNTPQKPQVQSEPVEPDEELENEGTGPVAIDEHAPDDDEFENLDGGWGDDFGDLGMGDDLGAQLVDDD